MIFDLFSEGFGSLLLLILIIIGVVLISKYDRLQPKPPSGPEQDTPETSRQTNEWRIYLESFRSDQLTPRERELLERILASDEAPDRGRAVWHTSGTDTNTGRTVPHGATGHNTLVSMTSQSAHAAETARLPIPEPSGSQAAPQFFKKDIDGTLLLLYFGAFLFATAAGLFVAFGGFSGGVRTVTVAITMAVLFFGGIWLHDRSARLKPAGMTGLRLPELFRCSR